MLEFGLIALGVIVITIVLVKLIDKFVPAKIKPVINLGLWVLIIFLGYNTFMTIYKPILFKEVKQERFQKVIDGLKLIRKAQLAHRQVTGDFSSDFDKLIAFIESAEYTITERRDTSVVDDVLTKQFGVTMTKDIVIVDTLGFVSVKDSLFKNDDSYKTMMNVPKGVTKEPMEYEMNSGYVNDSDNQIAVFEAFIKKDLVLFDQDENLVKQENKVASTVVGVTGDVLKVGSIDDVETGGNWAKFYDTKK